MHQVRRPKLVDRARAQQPDRVECLLVQDLQGVPRTGRPAGRPAGTQAIERRATGEDRVGTQGQRLEQVGAAPDAARQVR